VVSNIDPEDLRTHVDVALQHLVELRVALGIGEYVPDAPDALDDIFHRDEGAVEARRAVLEALEALRVSEGPNVRQAAFYRAEEAVNRLVVRALDVAWAAGWTTARSPSAR